MATKGTWRLSTCSDRGLQSVTFEDMLDTNTVNSLAPISRFAAIAVSHIPEFTARKPPFNVEVSADGDAVRWSDQLRSRFEQRETCSHNWFTQPNEWLVDRTPSAAMAKDPEAAFLAGRADRFIAKGQEAEARSYRPPPPL